MNGPLLRTPLPDPGQVLDVLRDLISDHVDLQGQEIDRATELATIGVDSLTAAEILFSLEDRLGVPLGEPSALPVTVGAVVDFALAALQRHADERLH